MGGLFDKSLYTHEGFFEIPEDSHFQSFYSSFKQSYVIFILIFRLRLKIFAYLTKKSRATLRKFINHKIKNIKIHFALEIKLFWMKTL